MAHNTDDKRLIVNVIIDLSKVLRETSDLHLAEGLLREAEEMLKVQYMVGMKETVLFSLGLVHKRQGQIEKAVKCLEAAISLYTDSGNQKQLAAALNSLGGCFVDRDESEKAIEVFQRGAKAADLAHNPRLQVSVLGNLGVALGSSQPEKALDVYDQALAKSKQIEWELGVAYNSMNKGDILFAMGRFKESKEHLQTALRSYESLGDQWGAALTQGTLGEVLTQEGDLESARRSLSTADEIFHNLGDQYRRGLIQCSWVRFFLAQKDEASARNCLLRARALSRQAATGSSSFLESQIREVCELLEVLTVGQKQA